MSDILYEHQTFNCQRVVLYSDRIEIQRGVLGMRRTETILLRNITNVEYGIRKRFTIHTADGNKHEVVIAGRYAEELRRKIAVALPRA